MFYIWYRQLFTSLYTTVESLQTTQKHQNYDSSVNYAVNWLFTFLQVAISNRLKNQQPTDTVSESSTFGVFSGKNAGGTPDFATENRW